MKPTIALLSLALSLSPLAAFSKDLDAGLVREGMYISTALSREACTAILTATSNRWGKKLFTLEIGQQNSVYQQDLGDFVMFRAKSDEFSLDILKKQIQENDGEFRLVTKQNTATENVISGKMYEEAASTYLELRVSNKTCVGMCSIKSATCTVRLK